MEATAKTFTVKVKPRIGLVIFVSIWGLSCLGMGGFLLVSLVTSLSDTSELYLVSLLLLTGAVFAGNYIRWQLTGIENLTVSDTSLRIFRTGTFFARQLVLKLNELDSVEFDEDKQTPTTIRLYGIGGGKVKLQYLGRQRRFGQDLTLTEAQKLSEELTAEIKKRNN